MDPKITRRAVAELTAKAFGTNLKALCSTSRSRELTKARFAVWYLIREFRHETSLKELGNMLDKDHTTVINGLVRAKEFAELNREFADRLQNARRMIAQWRPGDSQAAERVSSLVPVAKKEEPALRLKSVASTDIATIARMSGEDPYTVWQRESCRNAESRFLALASRMHPNLVRVPQKEAAE